MMRLFVPLALIGLAVVPDWATAFGWRVRCPQPRPLPPPPPTLVIVSPCLPLTIDPSPPVAAPLAHGPTSEPGVYVESQGATPATPPPAKPEEAQPEAPRLGVPKPPSPGIPPDSGTARGSSDATEPKSEAKPAGFATPTPAVPTLPPMTDPKPFDLKTGPSAPTLPPPRDTVAPAQPSEKPKTSGTPVIPPLTPPIPGGSDPAIPPLSIPPAHGGTNTRVAQSSPLSGGTSVDVFPVEGDPPAPNAKRTVGFFNHTGRVLTLTVEGETVTLPARHSVAASVPAKFTWTMDGSPERTAEVPAAAPGIEVVIRQPQK